MEAKINTAAGEAKRELGNNKQRKEMYAHMKEHVNRLESKFQIQQKQVASLWDRIRELLLCCKEALREAEKYRSRCKQLMHDFDVKHTVDVSDGALSKIRLSVDSIEKEYNPDSSL